MLAKFNDALAKEDCCVALNEIQNLLGKKEYGLALGNKFLLCKRNELA